MKLKLDEKEIAEVIKNWAQLKYKTKNVSAEYGVNMDGSKLKGVYLELEITLNDNEFTETSSQLAEEAVKNIASLLKRKNAEHYHEPEPDNQPEWNTSGEPI